MSDIKTIVVGVDGSDSSRTALHWAYDEAAHHGASLTILTTWHSPSTMPVSPPFGGLPPEDYQSQPRTEALDLLEQLTADLEAKTPAVDVSTSIEEGRNPAAVLIERSKEADLIVVASRGRGGFAGMLLGSVSQHVVAHAECPVVVIR